MTVVQLASDRIDGARATRTALFLHGILGSAPNLRTAAKRFVEACPAWSACLVDLRGHGRSPKGTPGASIEAAAADVAALAATLSPPVRAVVGHSFGGKVALELLRTSESIEDVVSIDSHPGTRPPLHGKDSALAVLDTVESLPRDFASKRAFIDAITEKHGRTLAQWLGMSTVTEDGRTRFALDRTEIHALLDSYFRVDCWDLVEAPPHGARVHVIVGERSSAYSSDDRARLASASAKEPRLTVHLLAADHWVHVDDPDGLQRVLVETLGALS